MRILVVEDDVRVGDLLRQTLEDADWEVLQAYDGEMGKKLILSQPIDFVILDLILPKINGLELCKIIREEKPQLPVLMLTALGTTDDKVEGFDAGADDYLVKPFEIRELLARIKAIAKRKLGEKQAPQKSVLQYADLEMNLHTKQVARNKISIDLTPKEFNLLKFMLQHPERVLSRTEIAEEVWETHFDTGTNFIDVYINYLRKKVDKKFSPKLIHTKPGMGFILKKP